jgi:hypothetical protein
MTSPEKALDRGEPKGNGIDQTPLQRAESSLYIRIPKPGKAQPRKDTIINAYSFETSNQ